MEGINPIDINTLTSGIEEVLPSASSILWSLFALIALYTLVHAAVFSYHWFKYNIAPGPFLRRTYLVYFSGIFVFLSTMLLSLFAILT